MNFALILAGGTGSRAGSALPKQFVAAGGRRLFWRSVEAFRTFDSECRIVLIVHPDYLERWDELFGAEERELGFEIAKTGGGVSRIESVKNGLEFIRGLLTEEQRSEARVFIHDSARPGVSAELIRRGSHAVGRGRGAVPVIPLADSIRRLDGAGSKAVARKDYVAVQTPQVFMFEDIYKAYSRVSADSDFTDDASVAENSGIPITLYEGAPENFKVTTPEDFKRL